MLFIEDNGFFTAFQFIVNIAYIKIHLNGFILVNHIHSGLWGAYDFVSSQPVYLFMQHSVFYKIVILYELSVNV